MVMVNGLHFHRGSPKHFTIPSRLPIYAPVGAVVVQFGVKCVAQGHKEGRGGSGISTANPSVIGPVTVLSLPYCSLQLLKSRGSKMVEQLTSLIGMPLKSNCVSRLLPLFSKEGHKHLSLSLHVICKAPDLQVENGSFPGLPWKTPGPRGYEKRLGSGRLPVDHPIPKSAPHQLMAQLNLLRAFH